MCSTLSRPALNPTQEQHVQVRPTTVKLLIHRDEKRARGKHALKHPRATPVCQVIVVSVCVGSHRCEAASSFCNVLND